MRRDSKRSNHQYCKKAYLNSICADFVQERSVMTDYDQCMPIRLQIAFQPQYSLCEGKKDKNMSVVQRTYNNYISPRSTHPSPSD